MLPNALPYFFQAASLYAKGVAKCLRQMTMARSDGFSEYPPSFATYRLLAYRIASAPAEAVDESMKTRCWPFSSSIQLSCLCRAGRKAPAPLCAAAVVGTRTAAAAAVPRLAIKARRVFLASFMWCSLLRSWKRISIIHCGPDQPLMRHEVPLGFPQVSN